MPSFFKPTPQEPEENEYTLFVVEEDAESAEEPAEAEVTVYPGDEFETEETASEPEKKSKLNIGQKLIFLFIPLKGDTAAAITQKLIALVALIAALASLVYLVYDLWFVPLQNETVNKGLSSMYDPDTLSPEAEEYDEYPVGMNPKFKELYYANHDIRGWLTFESSYRYWYGIDYPVVQSGDNDYYLYRDFYGNNNKNGTLFFDHRNNLSSSEASNAVTIIYGHNMLSGQMLASLNKLVGNLGIARSAPTIELSTLYEDATYKVFSVFIWDNENPDFNYMQTEFATDTQFLWFAEDLRAHSLYDYQDVDIQAGDEILILSTCSNKSQTHLSDGRTVVAARKVRDNESLNINTAHIVENEDVIMPAAWYAAEGKEAPSTTKTTTTTKANAGSTTSQSVSGSSATSSTSGRSTAPTTARTQSGGTTKPAKTTTTTTTAKPVDATTTTTKAGGSADTTTTSAATTTTTPATTTSTTAETTTTEAAETTATTTEATETTDTGETTASE